MGLLLLDMCGLCCCWQLLVLLLAVAENVACSRCDVAALLFSMPAQLPVDQLSNCLLAVLVLCFVGLGIRLAC